MKKSKIDEGRGYRIFIVFNTILMIAILIATAYPVYYVLIASISDPQQMAANYGLMLAPKFPLSVRSSDGLCQHPVHCGRGSGGQHGDDHSGRVLHDPEQIHAP